MGRRVSKGTPYKRPWSRKRRTGREHWYDQNNWGVWYLSRKDFGTLHAAAVARNFLSKPARRRSVGNGPKDRSSDRDHAPGAWREFASPRNRKQSSSFAMALHSSLQSGNQVDTQTIHGANPHAARGTPSTKFVPEYQGNRRGSRFCGSQSLQQGMQTTLGRESIPGSRAAAPRRVSSSNFHQQIARNGQRS